MFYMFLFINNSDNNKKINNTRQQIQFVHAYTTNVWSGSPVSLWLFFLGGGGLSCEKDLKSK